MPQVVILARSNRAGKSTAPVGLLPEDLSFVDASEMAKVLPDAEERNIAAGRLMRSKLDRLEQARLSFALETTLANRALAPRLVRLKNDFFPDAGRYVHILCNRKRSCVS